MQKPHKDSKNTSLNCITQRGIITDMGRHTHGWGEQCGGEEEMEERIMSVQILCLFLQITFRTVLESQKIYRVESSHVPRPSFSYCQSFLLTFATINKPTLITLSLKTILYPDFPSFHLMSFLSPRIPHHIYLPCVPRLLLAVTVSSGSQDPDSFEDSGSGILQHAPVGILLVTSVGLLLLGGRGETAEVRCIL